MVVMAKKVRPTHTHPNPQRKAKPAQQNPPVPNPEKKKPVNAKMEIESGSQQTSKQEEKKGGSDNSGKKMEVEGEGEKNAPSNELLTGQEEVSEAVKQIMAMGFTDQAKIKQALKAAFNNRERAVDYLINVRSLE
jgi:hypothetical protein